MANTHRSRPGISQGLLAVLRCTACLSMVEEHPKGLACSHFQADVFQLPFADESFDYIYSIGVLHHTPDCQAAFKMLPPLLKPGGRIAAWLYSGYNHWYRMSDVYRKITRRMSPQLLHKLCYGVVPLYALHKLLRRIPLVGRPASGALAYAVRMAFNSDPKWRILDTFDWYSPSTSPSIPMRRFSAGLRVADCET